MILDAEKLSQFLKVAIKELEGRWVLIGGTLLPAVGINLRSTVDIDIVGLSEKELSQNLELMRVAESLGLNVDTINQAAAFFFQKVPHTEKDLIPLIKGKKAIIYRPSFELYVRLKVQRLTETDVSDCLAYYSYCRQNDDIDSKALQESLKKILNKESNKARGARIRQILSVL